MIAGGRGGVDAGAQSLDDNAGCLTKFGPHLAELRYRIVATLVFLTAAVCIAFAFARRIYELLLYPLPEGTTLHFFAPTEAFFTDFKIALVAGIAVTIPFALYHIWRFVAPGLTSAEKRVVLSTIPWMLGLFVVGVVFSFFVVVPSGLLILLGWGGDRLIPVISVGRYFGFLFGLLIAGGLLFELPVVIAALARLGLVTPATLLKHSRTAIVIILLFSAVLTPSPDAFTMLLLAVPIMLLYFASVFIAGMFKPIGDHGRER
jgi:sec-independent protein translocase protein TatC